MKFDDLSDKQRSEICYEWLQNEGYLNMSGAKSSGYDSPREYYEGIQECKKKELMKFYYDTIRD